MTNKLKILRAERNISQQDLADAVEVSRCTINRIESGKSIPSGQTIMAIARFFNKDSKDIFLP